MTRARTIPPSVAAPLAGALGALLLFHAGYLIPGGWPMLGFPTALCGLLFLPSNRLAFYGGLLLGLGMYAPHLGFFWTLFGPPAVVLWLVLAFWIGVFLAVGQTLRTRLPTWGLIPLLPLLWTGLEYFRSELYFLRFSWLTPAMAWADPSTTPSLAGALHVAGSHGLGFLLFLGAALTWFTPGSWRLTGPLLIVAVAIAGTRPLPAAAPSRLLIVAGAQTESIPESGLISVLDRVLAEEPNVDLLVLPEYALDGEPGEDLRAWCRKATRHLIVGGREPLPGNRFHNTAFVLDPQGNLVFRQAKSVPIQFFDDGVPATSQTLWESPWGKIGIAICYDLSYTRVMDRLVRAGAEALVIPTMDALAWGASQHALHARVAPLRAAEYGLPIARVASSGISQVVDHTGRVTSSAPFSDDVEFLSGTLELRGAGSLPWDRQFGLIASASSVLLILLAALTSFRRRPPASATSPSAVPSR